MTLEMRVKETKEYKIGLYIKDISAKEDWDLTISTREFVKTGQEREVLNVVDLHRHSECSTFDGFGKAEELAALAKKLGYTSLGASDHGNTNGLVRHYFACKEEGIKPILGCEGYFLQKY